MGQGSKELMFVIKPRFEKWDRLNSMLTEVGDVCEDGNPHKGKIHSIDNRLDTRSGTIRVRAVFDNKERRFVPGLYAKLRLSGGVASKAVLTPDRAIGTDQSKKFVVVVGADGKPQFRDVQLGALQDGMRVVGGGKLKAGENIVIAAHGNSLRALVKYLEQESPKIHPSLSEAVARLVHAA